MKICEMCRALSQFSNRCPLHSMEAAIATGQPEEAYRIARQYNYPASTVRRLIRDKMERDLDASMTDLRASMASLE
jgi:hypothetical protein